jgi:hypothetical protein
MALRFKINGVDFTTKWRPYESSWTQRAWQGESSQSRFILDDDDGTINHADLAARKIVTVEEDASGSWVTLYRGRMMSHSVARGTIIAGVAARWTLTTEDSNIDARGIRVDSSTRPEESDRERVLAMRAGYLDGASSTNPNARDSTDISGTYVENIDLVTMPAETYTDTYPNEVFNRIVEISAKVWFVYVADDGTMHLFYATKDTATIQSTIEVWDNDPTVLDDDPDRYAPDRSVTVGNHDGQALISGGSVRYGDDQFYEYSHAGSEADHDKWEAHFTDQLIINAGSAEAFLENMVASLNNEEFSYTVRIRMTAANVHRLKAGMMTAIRLVAANLPTVTDQRAVEVTVEPKWPDENGDAFYWVTATFGIPRGKPFPRKIRTRPGPFPPTTTEPGTPETPDTVVAAWHFDTGVAGTTQLDDSSTYPVSGKWNAAGYAYSTNLTTQVATHSKTPRPAVVVGTTYRISARIKNRDLVRNPSGLNLVIGFKTGAGSTIATPVLIGGTGATEGVWVSVSGNAVAPATAATVFWSVTAGATGADFATAGTLADVDDVVISEVGTGTPAVPGSGGVHPDLEGDTDNQYARADHTHLTVSATDDPTVNDDASEGFGIGTWWYNEANGKTFLSLDSTTGAAVWLEMLNVNWEHSHDAEDINGLEGDLGGLTVTELAASPDGGWNALGKPNAAYYNGKTYWAYVTGDDGDVAIRSYNHLTGEISAATTLKAALDVDDHAPPTVLVRASDRRILVAYCGHNDANLYTRLSTNPEDISSFAAEVDIDASLGGTAYSYPSLIQLTGETNDPIYLFVRRVSGGASQTWGYSTSTDGGATWSALTTFFSVSGRWGYVTQVPNGDARIDFFAQDGSAGAGDATVSVYHFYLEGGAWFESDGTSAGSLPLDETDLTVVHSGATGGSKHIASIVPDPETGYPVVAYKVFTAATTADYRWGRWTGSAWSTAAVAGDGYFAVNYQSGDLCLDSKRPTVVYASRDVDGTMQLFRYHTRDRGATWSEEQLTDEPVDAIFPTSPFNRGAALPVLWMAGTWTNATTWATGTYGLVGEQAEPEGGSSDLAGYQLTSEKGQADGYASLDGDALVPVAELPVGTASDEVAAGDHTHAGGGGRYELLILDTPAGSPLIFADLVQNEAGTDLMYTDSPVTP